MCSWRLSAKVLKVDASQVLDWMKPQSGEDKGDTMSNPNERPANTGEIAYFQDPEKGDYSLSMHVAIVQLIRENENELPELDGQARRPDDLEQQPRRQRACRHGDLRSRVDLTGHERRHHRLVVQRQRPEGHLRRAPLPRGTGRRASRPRPSTSSR